VLLGRLLCQLAAPESAARLRVRESKLPLEFGFHGFSSIVFFFGWGHCRPHITECTYGDKLLRFEPGSFFKKAAGTQD
jgi:hypothetical protein